MQDNPLLILFLFGGALYLGHLWRQDFLAWKKREPVPKPLPGATSASGLLIVIGIVGAVLLVMAETAGEYALGVSAEQTDIVAIYLLAMLAAGFLEELIFRGFLFYDKKGPQILWLSIFAFSLLFALVHTQYYMHWEDGAAWYQFQLQIDAKSSWTLIILFLNSLWFYALRFGFGNTHRSLLPCFAAHIASNLTVFLVKLAQGHVVGWY